MQDRHETASGDGPRVKICGVTRVADAELAVELGADFLGLNFYPASPRAVRVAQAAMIASVVPPSVLRIGVFVNEAPSLTILVPSYKEEERIIRQSLWSAALQEYPGKLGNFIIGTAHAEDQDLTTGTSTTTVTRAVSVAV